MAEDEYSNGILNWRAEMDANLRRENDWLALAGLFWLKPGANTFGTDSSNAIVFPKGPAHAGTFDLQGTDVIVKFSPDAHAMIAGKPVTTAKLDPDTPIVVFTHSPLWDYYPRWNFQTEDAPDIRGILAKFSRVMAFHGHVHQTVYNRIGNLSSVGTLSTSWPWPYPDVQLAYPQMRMHRSDPGNFKDGEGSQYIDLEANFNGTMHYNPFGDMLTPAMKNGFVI